jgi:hypothetical protein
VSLGPVEFVVIGLPDGELNDDIALALAELVASNTVRILDLLVVMKDDDGLTSTIEYEDFVGAPAFIDLEGDVSSLLSDEDTIHVAASLTPGSSAIVILWEDLWARDFADAVALANGTILSGGRVPSDVMDAALASVQ